MKLVWTDSALQDLQDIHSRITADKASAATRVAAEFLQQAESLLLFPLRGSPGRVRVFALVANLTKPGIPRA